MRSITVVCQNVGNYQGRGREYVRKLLDGFQYYMPRDVEARYACVTDDPSSLPDYVDALDPAGLTGWWCKMAMLRPGMFQAGERIVACDLDTIITGGLSDIVAYDGNFAALSDPYHPHRLSSSLMMWRAGCLDHVWNEWNADGRPTDRFGVFGDGACIEHYHPDCDRIQDTCPGQIASYKVDCRKYSRMPPNTRVLFFHGVPKPADCTAPFVQALWKRDLSIACAA